jgi:hypothetical protein
VFQVEAYFESQTMNTNVDQLKLVQFILKDHAPKWWMSQKDAEPNLIVATLALGSRPRQRGCNGAGQREARESHQGLPGV